MELQLLRSSSLAEEMGANKVHVDISSADPFLVVNVPFARIVDPPELFAFSFSEYAVDVSLHNTLLWRHHRRYSEFAKLYERLSAAVGEEYRRALPALPPKRSNALAVETVQERQHLLPAFLRELLAICRNDFGEDALAAVCRPLLDEWLFDGQDTWPVVKASAPLSASLDVHRQNGGVWLAVVAARRIQAAWHGRVARKRTEAAANFAAAAALIVSPASSASASPAAAAAAPAEQSLLLKRMKAASTGSPLLERMKAARALHRSAALTASPKAAAGDGTRYTVLRAAVLRQGIELFSAQVGVVDAGSEIVAQEECSALDGSGQLRVRCNGGWVSGATAGGTPILQVLNDAADGTAAGEASSANEEQVALDKSMMLCSALPLLAGRERGPMQHTLQRAPGSDAAADTLRITRIGDTAAAGLTHRRVVELLQATPPPTLCCATSADAASPAAAPQHPAPSPSPVKSDAGASGNQSTAGSVARARAALGVIDSNTPTKATPSKVARTVSRRRGRWREEIADDPEPAAA